MDSVLWYIIPLGVAVALSIMPILAAVLILLTPDPVPVSIRYLTGWSLGVFILVTIFALGAKIIPRFGPEVIPPWVHWAEAALGVILLAYAVWSLTRPKKDITKQPGWTKAVAKMTPGRAMAFGFAMNVRPKNLTLAIAAGIAIGSASMDPLNGGIAILVFTLIGISTVAALVLSFLFGDKRVRPLLEKFSHWIELNSGFVLNLSLVMVALILIGLGVYNILFS